MVHEQEKWDSVFAAQDFTRVDPHIAAFNSELVEAVRAFLPEGEIAELGCGTGAQSLALANTGHYRLSCIDFSSIALDTARRLFEAHDRPAVFRNENVLEPGSPEFDLVFNAGVLEHYTFAEQTAFLRGMASRSRRFVLIFIPNSLCYWYWVWRVHVSGRGQWPYGKEVPRCDLSDVFAAAGLQFVGQKFFAQSWTELFIEQTLADRAIASAVIAAHRLPGVGAEQKSYLIGALGALPGIDIGWMQQLGWRGPGPIAGNFPRDEIATSLADSMATNIFLQSRVAALEAKESPQDSLVATLEHERAARAIAEKTIARLENTRREFEAFRNSAAQAAEAVQTQLRSAEQAAESAQTQLHSAVQAAESAQMQSRSAVLRLNHLTLDHRLALTRENHALQQLADARARASRLERQLNHATQLLVSAETFTAQAMAKCNLHFLLNVAQRAIPERVRAAVRRPYLNYFYYRVYPEKRPAEGATAAPGALTAPETLLPERPSAGAICHSGYEPFVNFKRQLWPRETADLRGVAVSDAPGLVSVVLPVYNGERYLRGSIESVLAQTYPNWELIIVDDGSTDGTGSILESYSSRTNIRIVRQQNRKLPGALTAGFNEARGEFFTWTSDDNLMHARQLEELVSFLDRNTDCEMVYGNMELIDENGDPVLHSDYCPGYQTPPGSNVIAYPHDPGMLNFEQNNYIGGCFLYRAWAGRIVGEYDDQCFGFEDYDYWMRMNSLFRLAHLDSTDPLYRYRVHPHSLSAREKELRIIERAAGFMRIEAERRAWFLEPFDVTFVGDHAWFESLAESLRQGGENVALLRDISKPDQRYSFTVTRAHPKALAAFSAALPDSSLAEALDFVRANAVQTCTALLFVDEGHSVPDTLLRRFDAVIASGDAAWTALRGSAPRRRFRISGPDAAVYPVLALSNAESWRSRRARESTETHPS